MSRHFVLTQLPPKLQDPAFRREFGDQTVRTDETRPMSIAVNGAGLQNGVADQTGSTLGLQLVRMLAKQLGGTVTFDSDGGTSVDVRVPLETADPERLRARA